MEEDSGGTNSEEGFDFAETTVLDPSSGDGEIHRQKQSLKENVLNWNLIQRLPSAHFIFMYRIQSPFK